MEFEVSGARPGSKATSSRWKQGSRKTEDGMNLTWIFNNLLFCSCCFPYFLFPKRFLKLLVVDTKTIWRRPLLTVASKELWTLTQLDLLQKESHRSFERSFSLKIPVKYFVELMLPQAQGMCLVVGLDKDSVEKHCGASWEVGGIQKSRQSWRIQNLLNPLTGENGFSQSFWVVCHLIYFWNHSIATPRFLSSLILAHIQ